jgi:hypothetical protein
MNFDEAVSKIAARDHLPRHVAMSKARRVHPDLFGGYQAQGREAIAKAATQPVGKPAAVTAFEKRVHGVQDRDRCSRLAALMKAARELPGGARSLRRRLNPR